MGLQYNSVFTESQSSVRNKLNVFHVHGYLPADLEEKAHLYTEKAGNKLVFSEAGYHEQYADPYSWSNVVQLNMFRERICLFLGLSMSDPNLRRVLYISASKNSNLRHYVIFRRESPQSMLEKVAQVYAVVCLVKQRIKESPGDKMLIEFLRELEDTPSPDKIRPEVLNRFVDFFHSVQEASFKAFGINTIWVEDHTEIPLILRQVSQ